MIDRRRTAATKTLIVTIICVIIIGTLAAVVVAAQLQAESEVHHTTHASSTQSTSSGAAAITKPSSLEVYVSANLTGSAGDQEIMARVWEENTSPAMLNVSVALAWSPLLGNQSPIGIPYGLGVLCVGGWPIGIGLMAGHETMGNLSQGRFVTPWVYSCTVNSVSLTYFSFLPYNDTATAGQVGQQGTKSTTTVTVSQEVTSDNLGPGTYTMVGGDEWGDIALSYLSIPA